MDERDGLTILKNDPRHQLLMRELPGGIDVAFGAVFALMGFLSAGAEKMRELESFHRDAGFLDIWSYMQSPAPEGVRSIPLPRIAAWAQALLGLIALGKSR